MLTLILIVSCSITGFCILTNALMRCCVNHEEPNLPPIPIRGVMLVEGEPVQNTSNAIDVVAYRNNTIPNSIEIDGTYIRVEEFAIGETKIHPVVYAVMV